MWRAIAALREGKLPVKWVRPEGIHLTMKFLGDVDDARQPELQAALSRAAGRRGEEGGGGGPRALTLTLSGFGVFPDYRRPRVVWVGVEAEAAVELLQHRVEQAFAPLGFPTEARAFRPHITLGRAARDARPAAFAGLETQLAGLSFDEAVVIETVDLMASTLQSGGAVYHLKHRERLL